MTPDSPVKVRRIEVIVPVALVNEVDSIVAADPALWNGRRDFIVHALRDAVLRHRQSRGNGRRSP